MHQVSINDILSSLIFPRGFVWGVATSAYQIEGAAALDGRAPSIWDTFAHQEGTIADHSSGDVACDHYHRLEQDLDLIAHMGIPAYRFSVSWSRVQPLGQGAWNEAGLQFYDRLIAGLAARGIAAHLTLYHWDLPQALQDQGGWAVRSTAHHFAAYARVIAARYGQQLASIATLNEPWVAATLGHEKGLFAPGLQERKLAMQVSHHLLLAHGLALSAMRELDLPAKLGIVLNQGPVHPASEQVADLAQAQLEDGLLIRWYMDPLFRGHYPHDVLTHLGADAPEVAPGDFDLISAPLDFLGLNYYTRSVAAAREQDAEEGIARVADINGTAADAPNLPNPPRLNLPEAKPIRQRRSPEVEGEPAKPQYHASANSSAAPTTPEHTALGVTAMGWEVYPDGLSELLRRLAREYALPAIYITENGAAYDDEVQGNRVMDSKRTHYLKLHVAALHDAIVAGVDVRGYFAWSLFDNFEWAFGYSKRFGLVYVDFVTQQRIVKDSGLWYRQFIAAQQRQPVAA